MDLYSLKMYTGNSRATTKNIKTRNTINMLREEIKYIKQSGETRERWKIRENKEQMEWVENIYKHGIVVG